MATKKILLWAGIAGSFGLLLGLWINILYSPLPTATENDTTVNVNGASPEYKQTKTDSIVHHADSKRETRQNNLKSNTKRATKEKQDVLPNSATANNQNAEQDFYSPENLDRLIGNTSVSDALSIARKLPDETVQGILNRIPEDYLKSKLAATELGFSNEELRENKPVALINSLLEVSETQPITDAAEVFFTTLVNPSDNSPGYASPYFYGDAKKIYACFRNEGAMVNFKEVVSLWKNTSTGKVVYWGKQVINPWSKWNYVFLEYKFAWPKGSYIVSFYKNASSSKCLAQGKFEVK
jgi:hypothetical protein